MSILQKFKNPLIWILGLMFKLLLKKIFFKNISNDDFKRFFSYTLELLPNETFINTIKLLINIFISKPSNLLELNIFNEVITHSIPQEQRLDVQGRLKVLFMFLMLSNIFKRTLFILKNIILLPFKLGVYSFLASLFGLKPDYLLSFFDVFKFNLPGWTYQKLVELHLSWMTWFKDILQIKSISTNLDTSSSLPRIKRPTIIVDPEPVVEIKPETYWYLTKTQWVYVSVSIVGLLAAYFGYTGGIPFIKNFEWESKPDEGNDPDSLDGFYLDRKSGVWIQGEKPWSTTILEKINPLNWRRGQVDIAPPLPVQDIQEEPIKKETFLSGRLAGRFFKFYGNTGQLPAPEQQSYWSKLSGWWPNNNDNELTLMEQQEKERHLDVLELIKTEYKSTNSSSPTHSDPEAAKEYDRLFPKVKDNSAAPIDNSKPAHERFYGPGAYDKFTKFENDPSLYSVPGGNDSTDTLKQENINIRNNPSSTLNTDIENNDLPSDITASELIPLTNPGSEIDETHTYPPKPTKFTGFSALAETPFARGFNENIDVEKIKITKGSLMFSSRHLSNLDKDKDKDDFNGDWDK